MTYIERIVELDGSITEREFTAEEIKALEVERAKIEAEQAREAAELAAKTQARQALLNKLGITEEEARLLLGGN